MTRYFAQLIFLLAMLAGATPALAFDPLDVERLLRNKTCEDCDLSGANLSGKDIANADLSGSDLSGANLSGANFTGSVFMEANLAGANLSKANLTKTLFIGADLTRADLRGATITDALFLVANLADAKMRDAIDGGGSYDGGSYFRYANVKGLDVLKAPGILYKASRRCMTEGIYAWHGFDKACSDE